MSTINASVVNNLPHTTQNSTDTAASNNVNENYNTRPVVFLGTGSSNIPGLSHIIYAPVELYKSVKAFYEAHQIGDQEGLFINGLRAAGSPINFTIAGMQLGWYAIKLGTILKIVQEGSQSNLMQLSKGIGVLGISICVIEGILESFGIVQTKRFHKFIYPSDLKGIAGARAESAHDLRKQKFNSSLCKFLNPSLPENLKNQIQTLLNSDLPQDLFCVQADALCTQIEEKIYLEKLNLLQNSYLKVSPRRKRKIEAYVEKKYPNLSEEAKKSKVDAIVANRLTQLKNALDRRMYPTLANEIRQTVPRIISDLQSPLEGTRLEGKEKAAQLFQKIQVQTDKKYTMHILGLLAVTFTLVGLILGFCALHFFIPMIILGIGGALAMARYCFEKGLMDSNGWTFQIAKIPPDWMKEFIVKLFAKPQQTPSSTSIDPQRVNLHFTLPTAQRERAPCPGLNFTLTLP